MDKTGRYARPECERRFLLDQIPESARQPRHITDRFLTGTRLRLRLVRNINTGEVIQRKLGHKVRLDPAQPTTVLHTSLYLDPLEYEALLPVDGTEVTKTRRSWSHDDHAAAIDSYDGPLAGLIVAELNFTDGDQLTAFEPSPPLGPEVTAVESLTGPHLARLTPEGLRHLLADLRSGTWTSG